jgi:hypothetical protein
MKASKLLVSILGLTISAAALNATSIDYLASADGLTLSSDYSLSATGGSLVIGNKNGVKFLGVTGGETGSEIDGNQAIKINFTAPERLASLSFVLMFNGGEYGDNNEIAAAYTSTGDLYQLRLVGENNAGWYKNDSFLHFVTGVGTQFGGEGKFVVENPFGHSTITKLKLYPVDNAKPGKDGSDFGLFGFTTFGPEHVPDAGSTLALMGLAVIAAAGVSRRLRR